MKPIKVIISGGGTGGHIYPAIAIADTLKELMPSVEILFVGALGKMEMEKVPKAGYQIVGLWISGIQRRLTLKNLMFPFKLIHSSLKARQLVKSFQPNVVVGVGGFASGPMMRMATSQNVPTLIQEQNGYAGLTNKLLANKVNRICVAYPKMEKYFPQDKLVFTGNPVRKDITELAMIQSEAFQYFGLDENKKTLLVIGGSLGARTLNESMKEGVEKLLAEGFQVIWQTGKFYFEEIDQLFKSRDESQIIIKPFINEMKYAYACANVVISRAGALSISEICLAAKPAILVPSPNVAEDHQTKNAMALVKENAAVLVKDATAKEELIDAAIQLLNDEERQEILKKTIVQFAKPNAAKDIAEEVLKLAKSKF